MTLVGELQEEATAIRTAVLAFYNRGGVQSYSDAGITVTRGNVEAWERRLDNLRSRIDSLSTTDSPINYYTPGDGWRT